MTEFLERLRADNEPTRTALAMTDAIHRHIEDVLADDPGDDDREVLLLLREAERFADALRRTLRNLTEVKYESDCSRPAIGITVVETSFEEANWRRHEGRLQGSDCAARPLSQGENRCSCCCSSGNSCRQVKSPLCWRISIRQATSRVGPSAPIAMGHTFTSFRPVPRRGRSDRSLSIDPIARTAAGST
jgi:hypothetical protein